MKRSIAIITLIQLVCLDIAAGIGFLMAKSQGNLFVDGVFQFLPFLNYAIFFYIVLVLISNVVFCRRISDGNFQEIIVFFSSILVISIFFSFIIYCLIKCGFVFSDLNWIGFLLEAIELKDFLYHNSLIPLFLHFV